MATLTHKGYGRIYVENELGIAKVKQIIGEIDVSELPYLPSNLISVFSEYPKVVYIGKFSDIDMNLLTAECWIQGVKVWVLDNGHQEYVRGAVTREIKTI